MIRVRIISFKLFTVIRHHEGCFFFHMRAMSPTALTNALNQTQKGLYAHKIFPTASNLFASKRFDICHVNVSKIGIYFMNMWLNSMNRTR